MEKSVVENSFFSFSLNFWIILLGVIVLVLLIILFLFFKSLKEEYRDNEKLKKEIKNKALEINRLKVELDSRSNLTSNNKIQVSVDIPKEISSAPTKIIADEKSNPIEMEIPPQRKIPDEVFFMPSPSIDGYFALSDKSEIFKETITLYKFIIHKNNPNKADFEFNSDAMGIKNAINYPDRCLEPVCIINSAYNPNTRKIITQKNGVADKIGDKWIVNSKAKIKYE